MTDLQAPPFDAGRGDLESQGRLYPQTPSLSARRLFTLEGTR